MILTCPHVSDPRGMADSTEDQARLPTLHMTQGAFAGLQRPAADVTDHLVRSLAP